MANKKQIFQLCTIQRGLGIIEGVAGGLSDETVKEALYTAVEMIEESVDRITEDKKGKTEDA